MGYVVTFTDFTPTPRADGIPYTAALLQESPTDVVAWTTIETVALDPVDANPAAPISRTFTTNNATIPVGFFRIVFTDAFGGLDPSAPLYHSVYGPDVPLATLDDVKRVMRLRDGTTVSDADLAIALSSAISVISKMIIPFGTTGRTSFYNAGVQSVLRLANLESSVVQVRAWERLEGAPRILTYGTEYIVDHGTVRLIGYYAPRWARVEVEHQFVGGVPAAVTDAVALTAASIYTQGPKLFSGMTSERIGDYSYTLSEKDSAGLIPGKAHALLKPFLKRSGVFVT